MERSEFPNFTTAETSSSSWSTTNGGRSAIESGSADCALPAIAGGNFQGFTTAAGAPVTIYDPATGDANGFGKTPFPNNTIPEAEYPQSTAVLKYLGTSTTAVLLRWVKYELRVHHHGTTESPGLDRPWRLHPVPEVAVCLPLQLGERRHPVDRIHGSGQQDHYQLLPVHGLQHMDHFAPHRQRSTVWLYPLLQLSWFVGGIHTDVVDRTRDSRASKAATPQPGAFQMWPLTRDRRVQQRAIWGAANGLGDRGGDGPYVLTDPTWQIIDNLSWMKGKHSLRFGFEYNRQTFNQLGQSVLARAIQLRPICYRAGIEGSQHGKRTLSGGDSLADFLLGDLYQATLRWPLRMPITCATYSPYVDDTYKILPNSPFQRASGTN
jgi:hypothetical protein